MKFAPKTKKLMDEHSARGYSIIIGNNPHMHERKKWQKFDLVLLARTNARTHGYCIRTVWAVKSTAQACREIIKKRIGMFDEKRIWEAWKKEAEP